MSDGSRHFDSAAAGYDLGHHMNVPDPDGFHGAVVEGLPFETDGELRVLDLGAGTGLLSAVVAERFPGAKITLADFSAGMLKVARRRFAGSSDRFEFCTLDYVREPLPGESGSYDLVVSALSFHHLTHADKRKTLSKVHAALAEGGRFVNADQILEESPEARHRHEDSTHHAEAIEKATLRTQMTWLREAGFEEVECRYEKNGFAVYGGRKSYRKEH